MDDIFLKACYGKEVDRIPVWFMRQAGRSLPGYRELRKKYGVIELAQTPELAAQISMEPVGLLGVDAAILFADIMLLPLSMGLDVRIVEGVGPIVDLPIKNARDIEKIQPFDRATMTYLEETIRILRTELKVPLIGFSGAPFTLASYLIEGSPSRNWVKTKQFMLEQPKEWDMLMTKLSDAVIGYLLMQIDAGAQAVQLFDSWVGCLSPWQYRTFVLPYMQKIFFGLRDKDVPRIHFGTDTGAMLKDFANVDCEVIGLDWRIDLPYAKTLIGAKAVQGNLDPVVLLGDTRTIEAAADQILGSISDWVRKGFIFNLGHGMLPESDDRKVKHLVDYIHGKQKK